MYLRWFVQNCLTNRDDFLRILRGTFSRWSRQKHFVDLFIFKYASYSISLQICYKYFLSYNSGRKQMTRQLGSFSFNLHGQTFKDTGAKMLQLIARRNVRDRYNADCSRPCFFARRIFA